VEDFILKSHDGQFDRVVVAVGRFLDGNRTLITIPNNQIQHKPGTRNLIWDVSRPDFEALLAKAKTKSEDVKAEQRRPAAGEASADPDVKKVRTALKKDSSVAQEMEAMTVSKENGRVVLKGEVDSRETKDRILTLAKEATPCEVVDEIQIAKASRPSR
jgi:hypothetical protein